MAGNKSVEEITRRVSLRNSAIRRSYGVPNFPLLVLEEVKLAGYKDPTEVGEKCREVMQAFATRNRGQAWRWESGERRKLRHKQKMLF
jgi:hypothetical protein